MLTAEKLGYWVIQWTEDWDPSLADLLAAAPELVLGKRIAITSCDSGPYIPSEAELAGGWCVIDRIAVSPKVEAISELPVPGFDEWYVFDSIPAVCPKRNFVNRYGFSPLGLDDDELRSFWLQIETARPVHVLGAGAPNMFLVTRNQDVFERVKRFNTSLDMAALRQSA
jgi:hypothetical protein